MAAGGISLADPLPTILAHALHGLAAIKQARDLNEWRSAADPLAAIAGEADRLVAALHLVRDVPELQTPDVKAALLGLTHLATSLSSTLMVMAADSLRVRTPVGAESAASVARAAEVQAEVRACLRGGAGAAGVGRGGSLRCWWGGCMWVLRGGVKEGFWVSRREVVEVGEKVRGVLGVEMVLAERLGARLGEGSEDLIKLNDADAALLGLPQTTSVKIEQWRAGMSD
ncbi:predicted protein [Chaetomium globosum CBS 148.51]|uniref:Uncharacterized protein n=1 Tax=Chaetomium globosum (strain ATCC 6205 / CBS 148.51 / DSM 1962 / NBRC 6347 / NRRL 1970) TaxID=306901 RepID=Q2H3N9_CHAGB|nr:uncharacterized protein CHGG_06726 [Chaetomium globosum CBS 148.51]EAQ90107.1 predicted protein [Chaetomium globosum CBS 148.51]